MLAVRQRLGHGAEGLQEVRAAQRLAGGQKLAHGLRCVPVGDLELWPEQLRSDPGKDQVEPPAEHHRAHAAGELAGDAEGLRVNGGRPVEHQQEALGHLARRGRHARINLRHEVAFWLVRAPVAQHDALGGVRHAPSQPEIALWRVILRPEGHRRPRPVVGQAPGDVVGWAVQVIEAGRGEDLHLHREFLERVFDQHLADQREGVGHAGLAPAQHLGVAELDALLGPGLDGVDAHLEQVPADPLQQGGVALFAPDVLEDLASTVQLNDRPDDPPVADEHGELADGGVRRQAVVEGALQAPVGVVHEDHVEECARNTVHDRHAHIIGLDFQRQPLAGLACIRHQARD